jgi:pilus assembly protein CpaC
MITAKTPGGVSLVIWNEAEQSQTFDLFVDLDILGLTQKIRETFPDEQGLVEAQKDMVILSGRASSKAVADKIYQVVSTATPKVISLLEVPTAPSKGEILLEVKFAEVNRVALSQFGVNLFSTGAAKNIGSVTTQQFGGISAPKITDAFGIRADPFPNIPVPTTGPSVEVFKGDTTISDVLNLFVFRPDIHLGAVIKALQQKNLLQILAEPNLLTQTGKEASFLVGGEFPFPVPQPGGGGGFSVFTVQFKEFGVRLNFTPTLTEDGKIHLKVRPEVSALDFANGVSILGTLIPALSTRRVETEMELGDGQSFAIAGLVDDRLTRTIQKIPGLGDIPILGQLFRSRSLNKTKTELLVMVTPHIVKPLTAEQVPAGPKFPAPFLPPAAPETPKPSAPK